MITQRLKYFLTLAEEKNYTRAAEKLFISQPALSKQIMLLEEALGVKLLMRTTKKVQLTFAGEILQLQGEKLLELERSTRHQLRIAGAVESVELMVGSETTWVERELSQLFMTFRDMYPNADIFLNRYSYEQLVQRLKNGQLDVAFMRVPDLRSLDSFDYYEIHTSHLAVFTNLGHRFATMNQVPVTELADEKLIMLRRTWSGPADEDFARLCRQHSIKPAVVHEYERAESIFFMLSTGSFVTLLSDDIRWEGLCVRPLEGATELHLCAVWRRGNSNPYVEDFIGILKQLHHA